MEPRGSLLCSEEPATGRCPEPDKSSPHFPILILYDKVQVKLSLCLTNHHAMKAYWGSGGIAPHIRWPQH
jgi:hypothetical protein